MNDTNQDRLERLKTIIEYLGPQEKNPIIEIDSLSRQVDDLTKENERLRHSLNDYEKLEAENAELRDKVVILEVCVEFLEAACEVVEIENN